MSEPKKMNETAKQLRVLGVVFLAIFALGMSSFASDTFMAWHWGISPLSTMATLFGLMGFFICELNAWRCDKW